MTALSGFIDGIGLLGPGLCGWTAAQPILRGAQPYVPAATVIPVPQRLPATEQRRTGRVTRLALAAGFEAAVAAGADPATLPAVFASSGGDGENCHQICEVLAGSERALSPTRFHNSVHNAPSGYWSIAAAAMEPANIVCAFDASFAAGLLEALASVALTASAHLLIAYDIDFPEPMRTQRPIPDAFAVALVLSPRRGPHTVAQLQAQLDTAPALPPAQSHPATQPPALHPALAQLAVQIPAARSLPLLGALAAATPASMAIEYLEPLRLQLQVRPC